MTAAPETVEMTVKHHSPAKLGLMQFLAGGCAGFVEVSIMHPLDLIKTRFQIQRGPDDPHRYTSLADCFKKMYRQEGALSFYKGILPPLCAEMPKRAVKFFTFEQYKTMYSYNSFLSQGVVFTLAGLSSGLTEAVIINPFEVVKVKLQSERGTISQDPVTEFCRKFVIGLIAGTLASCINIPFDVAKSRIQGPQPVPGQIKYSSCFATMLTIYREEGYLALYKGLLPKVLRLGPGGAIMLLVNEHAFEWMKNNF
ncbi:ODC [Mytilus edulis]|uniref:Mitochondrial 2-oxodicarboxylate carrier n=1 Tax=Mytilus edulis TaxID=6550 RepID=A0A8S3SRH6_MYTED|nr:ODC [Mytilus edulis]